MKKRLLKWVLLFGCLVSGGWANAQSGVKYPYVTTDSKGVVNTIVCRDYRGGISAEFMMPEEVRAKIYGPTPQYFKYTAGVGAAPKFRVAAKNAADLESYDLDTCYKYREDPSDTENTWRYPTFMELNLICLFYKQLEVLDAEFENSKIAYVSVVAVNRDAYPFAVTSKGVLLVQGLNSWDKYARCVREVD